MTRKSRPISEASPSHRSRVTPGRSSTSASFLPTRRLNRVDLPTLGRPIIATTGRLGIAPPYGTRALSSPPLRYPTHRAPVAGSARLSLDFARDERGGAQPRNRLLIRGHMPLLV